jgi:hypothetical protein
MTCRVDPDTHLVIDKTIKLLVRRHGLVSCWMRGTIRMIEMLEMPNEGEAAALYPKYGLV